MYIVGSSLARWQTLEEIPRIWYLPLGGYVIRVRWEHCNEHFKVGDRRLKQLQFHRLDTINLKSLINILSAFELACNTSSVYEVPMVWLLSLWRVDRQHTLPCPFPLPPPPPPSLPPPKLLKPISPSNTPRAMKEILKTHPEEVDYLLQSYSTNDLIATKDAAFPRFTHPRLCRRNKAHRSRR